MGTERRYVISGEIRWVELPSANGREQAGRRPGIVLTDASYNAQLPVALVVPLTTSQASLRFPGTLLLQPGDQNGLTAPSVALVFQLRAVDRSRIGSRLGKVGADALHEIHGLLDRLLGRSAEAVLERDQEPDGGSDTLAT